jgi:hypothetical protein
MSQEEEFHTATIYELTDPQGRFVGWQFNADDQSVIYAPSGLNLGQYQKSLLYSTIRSRRHQPPPRFQRLRQARHRRA